VSDEQQERVRSFEERRQRLTCAKVKCRRGEWSKERIMVNTRKVMGEVVYNNGEFAEIETFGVDGIETGLILETIQISRDDTNDGTKEFRRKFRVGVLLDITTTVEIKPTSKTPRDLEELSDAADEVQRGFELEFNRNTEKHGK
jgi:hypothetical protein